MTTYNSTKDRVRPPRVTPEYTARLRRRMREAREAYRAASSGLHTLSERDRMRTAKGGER